MSQVFSFFPMDNNKNNNLPFSLILEMSIKKPVFRSCLFCVFECLLSTSLQNSLKTGIFIFPESASLFAYFLGNAKK